jgi:hypothetical protein
MNPLIKSKSNPETRPPGLILKSKRPFKLANNYNNIMNRMDIALSEMNLEDNERIRAKICRTYYYNENENIIIVSNRTETLN